MPRGEHQGPFALSRAIDRADALGALGRRR